MQLQLPLQQGCGGSSSTATTNDDTTANGDGDASSWATATTTSTSSTTPTTTTARDPEPLHIPITVGLLDGGQGGELLPSITLELTRASESFEFDLSNTPLSTTPGGVQCVVPSLLRGFSAPVKLVMAPPLSSQQELTLATHDTDDFNRWEAGQRLGARSVMAELKDETADQKAEAFKTLSKAFKATLSEAHTAAQAQQSNGSGGAGSSPATINLSLAAYTLSLPDEGLLAELISGTGDPINPVAIAHARDHVKQRLVRDHYQPISEIYEMLTDHGEFAVDGASIGRRRLRNTCMHLLCSLRGGADTTHSSLGEEEEQALEQAGLGMAMEQFFTSNCMTDTLAAVQELVHTPVAAEDIVKEFHTDCKHDALMLDKWFAVQALADVPDALQRVKALKQRGDFSMTNPNRMRALVGSFVANRRHFHSSDGMGYVFLADAVMELNAINPQIAARMCAPLAQWRRFTPDRASLMREQLVRIRDLPDVSKDVFEVASKGAGQE